MNKFLLIIVAGLLVIGGAWLIKNNNKTQSDENIKTYKNLGLGITFNYPKYLTASTTDGVIVLHHDIAFENNGDCDMMGDENTYPRLTDFKVTIQKINKNLVSTMKAVSPYIPQENFVNDEVVVSPGFILSLIILFNKSGTSFGSNLLEKTILNYFTRYSDYKDFVLKK